VCEPTTSDGVRDFVRRSATVERARHSGGTGAGPVPE
jgi:hypothetical protein